MDEKAKFEEKMTNVKTLLSSIFTQAIESAYPECDGLPTMIQAAQNDKFGDYQCNSAMAIAKVCMFSNRFQKLYCLESLNYIFHWVETILYQYSFHLGGGWLTFLA